jgi:hypothetical protein
MSDSSLWAVNDPALRARAGQQLGEAPTPLAAHGRSGPGRAAPTAPGSTGAG